MKKAGVGSGQRVLIYGASGAIGTAAVQLAKHSGAHVTAACGPANVELVKSLGADAVLDYTRDALPEGARYDRVIDAVGRSKTSALKVASQTALAAGGTYLSVDDGRPRFGAQDLVFLTQLAEQGALKPVIDRRYPLERIADAHRYVELGHKRGNVIVEVA
ncbi:MAG TPA: NAD(P)-dependent alcohol dehydrogenase [Gemmatimonadales bacterium]|nr:NAD(P)-dependent alcohol dehydrogenase [Gemmatimonadales bacterium]